MMSKDFVTASPLKYIGGKILRTTKKMKGLKESLMKQKARKVKYP